MDAEFRITHHPIYRMPTRQEAERLGHEKTGEWIVRENRLFRFERDDPYKHGYEPAIWHLCDDLLCDGHKIILDLTRCAEISPGGNPPQGFVPTEIAGACELWVAGGNRSGKSEFAAKKVMKILVNQAGARTWSFADTSSTSIARQQPIFFKYLPVEIKKEMGGSGKLKYGVAANVVFRKKTGFSDE
jgi:hypothetical protein